MKRPFARSFLLAPSRENGSRKYSISSSILSATLPCRLVIDAYWLAASLSRNPSSSPPASPPPAAHWNYPVVTARGAGTQLATSFADFFCFPAKLHPISLLGFPRDSPSSHRYQGPDREPLLSRRQPRYSRCPIPVVGLVSSSF